MLCLTKTLASAFKLGFRPSAHEQRFCWVCVRLLKGVLLQNWSSALVLSGWHCQWAVPWGLWDVHSGAGLLWCPPWGKDPHLEERGGRGEEDFPYTWWAVMLELSGEENVGSQIILGGKKPTPYFYTGKFFELLLSLISFYIIRGAFQIR